jgi:hypothetical protein
VTPEDPDPPVEARRLEAFLGEWNVVGTLTTEEGPAVVSGRWRFESAVNGWGVLGVLHTEIEGVGAFEENELIGFDANEGKIHLFSMNKFAIRDHTGGWLDEVRLRVQWQVAQGSAHVIEAIEIEFATPDRMIGRVIETTDGVVVATTDLKISRRA